MSDGLIEQPIEYRYPADERPTVAPLDRLPDGTGEWCNCWDLHPIEHGGAFVRWDGDGWDVIEVAPPSAIPGREAHCVTVHRINPSDVWADPSDPMTDWSDRMKPRLKALHNTPAHPNVPEVFDRLEGHVYDLASYGHGRVRSPGLIDGLTTPEAYWNRLEKWDIDPDDIDHLADEQRPDGE